MLHEDQQVGRPILQHFYTDELCALVIHHLRENTEQRVKYKQRNKHNRTLFYSLLFTHIIQIILEILILSADDAHGCVWALSAKHALQERGREREEENKTISKHYVLHFEPAGFLFDVLSPRWAEPDTKTD